MIKRVYSFLAILLSCIFITGCAANASPKDTLYVATPIHNGLYNPLYAVTVYDEDVCNLIYEGLVVDYPEGLNRVNDNLVESLEVSEDGLDYIFKLNPNAKFSNGKSLTANDVVFTYKTLADPSSTAHLSNYILALQDGEAYMNGETTEFSGVQALDEHSVVFHFKSRQRANLKTCSVKIISQQYYPDWEQGNADFSMHEKMKMPLGSGPYKIKQFKEGEKVVLERNNDYWAKDKTDYTIKNIEISFLKPDEIVPALKDGSVDLIPQLNNPDSYRELESWKKSDPEADLEFTMFQRNAYGFVGFNTRSGFSSDVAVRQAVAYAFDRDGFVQQNFGEWGESVNAQMPSSSDLYKLLGTELNDYEYDLEKALQALYDAGYSLEENTLYRDETPVVLKFLVTKDNWTADKIQKELSRALNEIGIKLEIQEIPFGDIINVIRSENDDWSMFFMVDDWRGDDPNELTTYFNSKLIPATNVTRYKNTLVDEFLDYAEQNTEAYSQDTLNAYRDVIIQLNYDLPEMPIFTNNVVAVNSSRVKNLDFGTYQRWSEGLDGAYIEK